MAYGPTPRPEGSKPSDLRPRLYPLPPRAQTSDRAAILCVPFCATGATTQEEYEQSHGELPLAAPPALVELLASIFNDELTLGLTYPHRAPMSLSDFTAYFLSSDLIVAFFLPASHLALASLPSPLPSTGLAAPLSLLPHPLPSAPLLRTLAGFYYIKPNYPGRSAHNCNAGFVVPPPNRRLGLGGVLGRSYLHYAPRAGYRASVFNLVYVNNVASVRIWEGLGFTKVGRVPNAGLLRRADGEGEEYVDAWVIYKDLVGLDERGEEAAGGQEVPDGSVPAL